MSRAEAGHFDTLALRTLRRICGALDLRLDLNGRWRGGELDRLMDSRHSAVESAAASALIGYQWQTLQEVTYAFYRDRGSIDLLGLKRDVAAAAVMEIKSEVTSWEETQRRFDEKVRLAPKIVKERVGWWPRMVARVLIIEDNSTNRRRIAQLGAIAAVAYPARTREVREWLRQPSGPLSGIWFLSPIHDGGRKGRDGGFHRVRKTSRG